MDGKCTLGPGRLLGNRVLDFWRVLFVRMLALLIAQGQAPAGKYYYILFWQIPRQSGRQMMLIVLGGSSSLCARCVALVYETEKRVTLMHAQPHKNEHRHGIWLVPHLIVSVAYKSVNIVL